MKKIIVIFRTICIAIILLLATLIFIPNLMGITPSIDLLGKMEPAVSKKSVTYINKKTKYENIKVNDIIEIKKYNQKTLVRVISKDDNNKTFSVKGDAENKQDMIIISSNEYEGKYIFSIPKIGVFILFMQRNFFITILIIIGILISLLIDFIRYKNIDITKTLKLDKVIKNKNKPKIESDKKATETKEQNKKVVTKNPDYPTEILDEKEVNEILEILDSDKDEENNENTVSNEAKIIKNIEETDDDNENVELL